MAQTKPSTLEPSNSPEAKHIFRTLIAALFGIIAFLLIFVSILVFWLNQTLTNNTVYVDTVAPLANQSTIQNFIAQKVTNEITDNTSVQNLASNLLPASEIAGQTQAQIQTEVNSTINQTVLQIVHSAAFSALWRATNQTADQQLISELNSSSTVLNLDLHPAIVGVISLLNNTNLAPVQSQLNIPSNAGVLSIKGSAIGKVHTYYKDFKEGTWLLILLTLICIGICVWASVHHVKTLRRILMGTGIITLLLAAALKAPSLILSSKTKGLQQQAILSIVNTLLGKLFITCLIVGIVCIVLALGSKLYSKRFSKHKLTTS